MKRGGFRKDRKLFNEHPLVHVSQPRLFKTCFLALGLADQIASLSLRIVRDGVQAAFRTIRKENQTCDTPATQAQHFSVPKFSSAKKMQSS